MQDIHKPREKSKRDAEINTPPQEPFKVFLTQRRRKENEFSLVLGTNVFKEL